MPLQIFPPFETSLNGGNSTGQKLCAQMLEELSNETPASFGLKLFGSDWVGRSDR